MIGIINYGSGNIEAIANIYNRLNIEYKVINKLEEFENLFLELTCPRIFQQK